LIVGFEQLITKLDTSPGGNTVIMGPGRDDPDEHFETLSVPTNATAPAVARTYLTEHAAWLSAGQLDDALLLVTELVTNAIRYGEPDITLQLRAQPPEVGIGVHDRGRAMPHMADPAANEPGGRGLIIVDAVAQQWGVTPAQPPPGKTVWFTLGAPPVAP
jgi:anti-sigma regulatory factor (Ser/Thr protein kinase)